MHLNFFQKRSTLIIFVLIFLIALFLRINKIGEYTFNVDELIHVYTGKSLLQTGEPTLPSGKPYKRALLFTKIAAYSFKLFPANETYARIPSVVSNLALIVALFVVGSCWFGPRVGLLASFLVAVSPLDVALSRFFRMYAPLEFLYFIGAICFYSVSINQLSLWRRLPYLLLGSFFIGLSYLFHPGSLTLIPAALVFLALISWEEKEARLALVLIVLTLTLLATRQEFIAGLYSIASQATTKLPWDTSGYGYRLFYVDFLITHYTWLFWIYPLTAIVTIYLYGRKALYLVCNFTVPLVFFTFFVTTNAPRYYLHIFPFFLLIVAVGLVRIAEWAHRAIVRILKESRWGAFERSIRQPAFCLLAGIIILQSNWVQESFMIGTKKIYDIPSNLLIPSTAIVIGDSLGFGNLIQSAGVRTKPSYKIFDLKFYEWREVRAYLAKRKKRDHIVVVSAPLAAHYYLGKIDYTFNPGLKNSIMELRSENGESLSVEMYVGSRYLRNITDVRRLVESNFKGWFIVDRYAHFDGGTDKPRSELGHFLVDRMENHKLGVEGKLEIFSWGINEDKL